MVDHHEYFGGIMRVQMDNGHHEEIWLDRNLWFDLDIDGRWLVGVTGPDPTDETLIGAIVVRDRTMCRFIEMLGRLIADPSQFAGEPVLLGPD
jgi:hypothetical protein